MTTITIKEAAEIKCCTVQYLQKQALNGEISTVTELTKNNRKRYMIPLSEFTTEEQIKYYKLHDMPLPEELEKPKKTKKRSVAVRILKTIRLISVTRWLSGIKFYRSGTVIVSASRQRYRRQRNLLK